MNAELERCKRKTGGKRKLEGVNKEAGQKKRPKLKRGSPEDQEIKNPENRLKKEDDLKKNLEALEVIKN